MMAKLSDAEKTATIGALLAEKYPHPRFAAMWECAVGTGHVFRARYADLLVLNLWPSDGIELHGFEVKASRADLKKELADPAKAHALARYCHRWTLVTYDTAVVGTTTLPESWGWWSVKPEGDGFQVHQRAAARTPEPWPAEFMAALVRRAATESPNAVLAGMAAQAAVVRTQVAVRRDAKVAVEAAYRRGFFRALGIEEKPDARWTHREAWAAWVEAWPADRDAAMRAGFL